MHEVQKVAAADVLCSFACCFCYHFSPPRLSLQLYGGNIKTHHKHFSSPLLLLLPSPDSPKSERSPEWDSCINNHFAKESKRFLQCIILKCFGNLTSNKHLFTGAWSRAVRKCHPRVIYLKNYLSPFTRCSLPPLPRLHMIQMYIA